MKIKVGNKWFTCEPGQPIMIVLEDRDKCNIANMRPEYTKYAVFDDSDELTVDEKLVWMEAEEGGCVKPR